MNTNETFQKIKNFLETNPSSHKFSQLLLNNAEITIRVGDAIECVYFRHNNAPYVEKRAAKNEVLELIFTPEGIDLLTASQPKEATDLIADFFKIYLSDQVKVKVHGSIEFLRGHLMTALSKLPSKDDLKGITQMILKKFYQK